MGNLESLQKFCSCYFFEGDLFWCFMFHVSIFTLSLRPWLGVCINDPRNPIVIMMVWNVVFLKLPPSNFLRKTQAAKKPGLQNLIIHVPTVQERPGSFFGVYFTRWAQKPLLKGVC